MCFEYLECFTPVGCLSKVFLSVTTVLRIYREEKKPAVLQKRLRVKSTPMLTCALSLWGYIDPVFTLASRLCWTHKASPSRFCKWSLALGCRSLGVPGLTSAGFVRCNHMDSEESADGFQSRRSFRLKPNAHCH